MFRDKDDTTNYSTTTADVTVLKEDATFEGKLLFDGAVLVQGKLKGEICSNGDLTVGKNGLLEGTIEIGTIIVHGEVRGNIKAKNKIVINAPAVVRGDIIAPSLIIEEGALFEGSCTMGRANVTATADNKKSVQTNVFDLPKSANDTF